MPSRFNDISTRDQPDGERLRMLVDLVSDDIWECDDNLRLIKVQGKGEKRRPLLTVFVGFTPDEIVDAKAPPEDFARIKEAIAAREPFRNLTLPVRVPGGELEWLRLSGFPLFFAHNSGFSGYFGTSTRITAERRRLEVERRRQQMESLGQLAGGVAHEFNNLLVPITMLSKLALARVGNDEMQRTFLTTIHESGWKAAQIVRSIMTYARQLTPVVGPVACGEVVAECIKLMRQALLCSVVIETDINDTTSKVLGSSSELSQIIVNLVNNAGEAVGDGGRIGCSVARVQLTTSQRGLYGIVSPEALRIIVTDSGCGIAPEVLDHVFEPFFTTKPPGQGTGLGLSVVDGIVKDWGGNIAIASTIGRGTEITILLPVVD
ncbi:MAG: ATP-binding protein [Rhodospirillaceae bacterium]